MQTFNKMSNFSLNSFFKLLCNKDFTKNCSRVKIVGEYVSYKGLRSSQA